VFLQRIVNVVPLWLLAAHTPFALSLRPLGRHRGYRRKGLSQPDGRRNQNKEHPFLLPPQKGTSAASSAALFFLISALPWGHSRQP
jgi:hypothetical protein